MANSSLMHNLAPFVILIAIAVLLKAWLARPSGPTLDVRPAPLMTHMERRTIAYIEAALPWARIHAQASMGAILASKKGLNRSRATSVRPGSPASGSLCRLWRLSLYGTIEPLPHRCRCRTSGVRVGIP